LIFSVHHHLLNGTLWWLMWLFCGVRIVQVRVHTTWSRSNIHCWSLSESWKQLFYYPVFVLVYSSRHIGINRIDSLMLFSDSLAWA
jgi:hypothetical protein